MDLSHSEMRITDILAPDRRLHGWAFRGSTQPDSMPRSPAKVFEVVSSSDPHMVKLLRHAAALVERGTILGGAGCVLRAVQRVRRCVVLLCPAAAVLGFFCCVVLCSIKFRLARAKHIDPEPHTNSANFFDDKGGIA